MICEVARPFTARFPDGSLRRLRAGDRLRLDDEEQARRLLERGLVRPVDLDELLRLPLEEFARLELALRVRTPGGELLLASDEDMARWLREERGEHVPILTARQVGALLRVTGGDRRAIRLILEALRALDGELAEVEARR